MVKDEGIHTNETKRGVGIMSIEEKTIRAVIGDNVRRIRAEQQLTAEELARELRVYGLKWNNTRISELENGHKAVGIAELILLSHTFDVTTADLLVGSGDVALTDTAAISAAHLRQAFSGQQVGLSKIKRHDTPSKRTT